MERAVTIVEVAPRDGLQSDGAVVPTEAKLELIQRCVDAGIRRIEATSFVNPKRVPQMADADDVMAGLHRRRGAAPPDAPIRRASFIGPGLGEWALDVAVARPQGDLLTVEPVLPNLPHRLARVTWLLQSAIIVRVIDRALLPATARQGTMSGAGGHGCGDETGAQAAAASVEWSHLHSSRTQRARQSRVAVEPAVWRRVGLDPMRDTHRGFRSAPVA